VGSRLQWCSEHGSKIDEIIRLVRSIVSEKKEKVLIFAQWSESTDKLEEALVAAKVPFSVFRKH
jgi:alkyl hydroperoxide reductase subunit AhpC